MSKNIIPHKAGFRQDPFREIRERVSVWEVAEHFGFHPNRAGFICCPFHSEKTPSLKLYPQSWYCFGCKNGGDVVDFVARLHNTTPLEALKKLNKDFSLGFNLDTPHVPTKAEREAAQERQKVRDLLVAFEEWRGGIIRRLTECCYLANYARTHKAPAEWTDSEVYAIKEYGRIEWLLDELDSDDRRPESGRKQLAIYRMKVEVDALCCLILQ